MISLRVGARVEFGFRSGRGIMVVVIEPSLFIMNRVC